MKCVDARHLIHLSVGDDTLPEEEAQLSEHLHSCSDCRAYSAGMVDAMHAIEQTRDAVSDDIDDSPSLWPSISGRIASRTVRAIPARKQFSGSVAALCACSLTLALVTIVQNLPANSSADPYMSPTVPAMNVNWSQAADRHAQPLGLLRVVNPDGSTVGFVRSTMSLEPASQAATYQQLQAADGETSF
jgi:hypothetical protein